jgi:hypothetical protein
MSENQEKQKDDKTLKIIQIVCLGIVSPIIITLSLLYGFEII